MVLDITKLKGPARGIWYLLYVIIDIYSRKAIHWEAWPTENGTLAKEFIEYAIQANGRIAPQAVHADRGTSMTSNTVAGLYARLGIDQSHSRPHVSNDNPYSEANFKTLKYCPAFPGEFGSIEDVNVFCRDFFWYYNNEHRHSGIAMHTPATVHDGSGSPSKPAAPPPSTPPTEPTPGGSTAAPGRARCLPTRGSTNRPQPAPRRTSHHRPRKQPDVSFDLTDSAWPAARLQPLQQLRRGHSHICPGPCGVRQDLVYQAQQQRPPPGHRQQPSGQRRI